jgi:hypothetical protein
MSAFQNKVKEINDRVKDLEWKFSRVHTLYVNAYGKLKDCENSPCYSSIEEDWDDPTVEFVPGYDFHTETIFDYFYSITDDLMNYYKNKPNSSWFEDRHYIRDDYDGLLNRIDELIGNMYDVTEEYQTYRNFCIYCRLIPIVKEMSLIVQRLNDNIEFITIPITPEGIPRQIDRRVADRKRYKYKD